MRRLLNNVNVLSIDVALGSVCAALFFVRFLDAEVSAISLVVLALTVWIIYTIDHLMDARRIPGIASSERHRFHQEHFTVLRNVVICAAMIVGALLFFLPSILLLHGIALSTGVVAYLLLHSFVPYLKEFAVALIYTAGVFVPSANSLDLQALPIALLISFFCVAYINLLTFSWFSESEDRRDGIPSLTTLAGTTFLKSAVTILMLIQTALLIRAGFDSAFVILFVMSCTLSSMFVFERFFRVKDRYRFGDAVFFMTVIYFLP